MQTLMRLLSGVLAFLAALAGAVERLIGMLVGALVGCVATILLWQEYVDVFHFSPAGDLWWKLGPGALVGAAIGYWLAGLITGVLFSDVSDDANRKR